MDSKALYKLSYGLFMLGSQMDGKQNACITNTCMQLTSKPARVAIAVLRTNYTCEMIQKSGVFAVTILNENCPYEFIENFGYQSGRNADKFVGYTPSLDANGCPYLEDYACAVLSCKVESVQEMDSHILFIAEVSDAKLVSNEQPLTYAYYQAAIKPKPKTDKKDKKIIGWRCKICNYVYEGEVLPEDFTCPLCGHGKEDFEPIYEE
jgi:flavin reductase (DIM6/NTAB) family NADH-FMN oxidoreductase RutF/rubredoxin